MDDAVRVRQQAALDPAVQRDVGAGDDAQKRYRRTRASAARLGQRGRCPGPSARRECSPAGRATDPNRRRASPRATSPAPPPTRRQSGSGVRCRRATKLS
jgi:hypothetical protein